MVPKIFSGRSHKPLAEKVCKILKTSLSPLEIHVFPDGEKRVRVEDSVLDIDTVVIQPTSHPADGNYMELFFIIDALKRSGAKSVTAVIPYLGYQRQDHIFRDGEAVSLEVAIRALESAGVSKVVVFDLHSIKIPELFSVPVSHLSALEIMADKIRKSVDSNTFLVSPDMGGIRRVKIISELLNSLPFATIVKNRDLNTGKITATEIEGKILKHAIIVDDMISSGKTIVAAADLLKEKGVEDVVVMATHAVFSVDAPTVLQNSAVSKVIVTDSVRLSDSKKFDKLEVLSIAEEIAKEITKK